MVETRQSILKVHIEGQVVNEAELDYPPADDIEEEIWLLAASRNPVFEDLYDPEEDIYSLSDGKPFYD